MYFPILIRFCPFLSNKNFYIMNFSCLLYFCKYLHSIYGYFHFTIADSGGADALNINLTI